MTAANSEARKRAEEAGPRPVIHLQGIGKAPAKTAGELEVGDILTWNYGYRYEVVAVTPCGKQSIRVTERSLKDGKEYTRTMRTSRLVSA
jgi:uncharacterized protein (DUF2147 family)